MKLKVSFFGPIKRPWPESTREVEAADGISIEGLLEQLGYAAEDMRRVATVVNGKKSKASAILEAGDDIRFVLLAGGG